MLIAIYSLAVLGYITATLTSFFIDMDSADKTGKAVQNQLQDVMQELKMLREEIQKQQKG